LRGLFPSLGAGGSLIAAALCAFLVLGGVFAFRGESPGTAQAKAKDLAVPAGAVRLRTASKVSFATAAAPPRRAAVAPRRVASQPRRTATVALPERSGSPTEPGTPPAATTPSAGGTNRPPAPAPAATPGTVTSMVRQTRAAVQPVVNAAPQPAQTPVNSAADAAEHVAGTVDSVLNP
jgi:hypothetical protein